MIVSSPNRRRFLGSVASIACICALPACGIAVEDSATSSGTEQADLALLPASGTLERTFMTDGFVNSVAQLGNTIYLGGQFTYIGQRSGPWAAVNASSGQRNKDYPELGGGTVQAVLPDGLGGYYIGGSFRSVGTAKRRALVHLRADKTVDPKLNVAANGTVYALAKQGNILYVGGDFTTLGGIARGRVGAIDLTTGKVTTWDPRVVGTPQIIVPSVRAIALNGNAVVLGGYFESVQGVARKNLTAVDAITGAPTVWSHATDNAQVVRALAVHGSSLFVLPLFKSLDLATGDSDGWNPGITWDTEQFGGAESAALTVHANTLYVGGRVTGAGGQPRKGVAAFDLTTHALLPWAPAIDPDGSVDEIRVDSAGGSIYLGGHFDSVNGLSRRNLAVVSAASGALEPLNQRTSDDVHTIDLAGSELFVGGDFTSVGGELRTNLAAIDATTRRALAWKPSTEGLYGGRVNKVVAIEGRVFVGGMFNRVNGTTMAGFAALDAASGAILASFPTLREASAYDLLVDGTTLFIGGGFSELQYPNGSHISRQSVAAIDATSGAALPFAPVFANAGHITTALALSLGTLFVGAPFGAESVNAVTGASTGVSFSAGFGDTTAIAVDGSTVYLGGTFSTPLASYDTATGQRLPWDPALTGKDLRVSSLLNSGGTLYVGGTFTNAGGALRRDLAGFDLATHALTALTLDITGGDTRPPKYWDRTPRIDPVGVNAMVRVPGHLLLGGDFHSIGMVDQSGFARVALPQ
jgi:trimeric autotransporter adhesin